jgi:deoxyribodipyrimidine photo-lyase
MIRSGIEGSLMGEPISIVWFRMDLRLADNPALHQASKGGMVVPVFIWSPEEEGAWPPGAASKWWLHQSLRQLDSSLRSIGSRLVLRQGQAFQELSRLAKETGATAVFWNRRYEPGMTQRDRHVDHALQEAGLHTATFNSALLFEPWTISNKSGKPFQVFTPFWKTCLNGEPPAKPVPAPKRLRTSATHPESLPLAALRLEPSLPWAKGIAKHWSPGESGANAALKRFRKSILKNYDSSRNHPAEEGTSSLSPHLHLGEISPRQIWHSSGATLNTQGQFFTELGWREFAYHLLYHFPHTATHPLRSEFASFPWRDDPSVLKAWEKGQTGYPLVDAGMRQLWAIGWMHNRVRMIAASFLVKDLLIPWQRGAAWFWDTLVDADLASNTLGWQWTAGCGADAAPFFRIFNPVSQGEKFDPNGDYVRQWVPELAQLPPRWIHRPWEAPAQVLATTGITLGVDYPERIVGHATAREVALEAYSKLKYKRQTRQSYAPRLE